MLIRGLRIGRTEIAVAVLSAMLSLLGYYAWEAWSTGPVDGTDAMDGRQRAAAVLRAGFVNEHVIDDGAILARLQDGSRFVCAFAPATATLERCDRLRAATD